MIHLIYGNDQKSKTEYIKKIAKDIPAISISSKIITEGMLLSYAQQQSLFGGNQVYAVENPLSFSEVVFSENLLESLNDSDTDFIFLEDAMTVAEIKKYKKNIKHIEKFEVVEKKQTPKMDPFSVANFYGKKDKINTWTSYISLIETGENPEAIAGMLFWKIKNLYSNPSQKDFSKTQLENSSSKLVDLYHKSHRGECDMTVALEQFILTTL